MCSLPSNVLVSDTDHTFSLEKTHRDLFLKVLVQSMATLRSKAEAEYVATVFSIDRSQHCLLHDIPWNPTNAAEKKTLSAAEFLDNRIVYLRCESRCNNTTFDLPGPIPGIFRNLAQSLRREVEGDTSLTADNQKYLGWLSTMVSVMQDIHQVRVPYTDIASQKLIQISRKECNWCRKRAI